MNSVTAIVKRNAKDLIWPIVRWKKTPEVILKTHYPGAVINIKKLDQSWDVQVTNRDSYKIKSEDISSFFIRLLDKELSDISELRRGLAVDFRRDSISLENWRDIFEQRIQDLIDDKDDSFENNKVGAFGFLKGKTKPTRLKFIEYSNAYPNYFEYIETPKYSSNMENYISLLDYKRKFKYVIDLTGHTYSTKSYWMLFLKRPMFYTEPNLKFHWERKLKPWVHYIPVSRNLSNLVKHYEWAENNPGKVQEISENLYDFALREMSPQKVIQKLVVDIRKCAD